MGTFVLVHGSCLGGWVWRRVADPLRQAGHAVHTPTLTGLGERVHLARPDVDLDTHVQDVVNHLAFEDLADVVLVGHSYSGMVITGVAERVPERLARSAAICGARAHRAWLGLPRSALGPLGDDYEAARSGRPSSFCSIGIFG